MAQDSFGYGTEKDELTWDDPWGDNITIPHRNSQRLTGEEAEKYNPFFGSMPKYHDYFQGTLYRFHTKQDPDLTKVPDEDLIRLMEWYSEIGSQNTEDDDPWIAEQKFALDRIGKELSKRG